MHGSSCKMSVRANSSVALQAVFATKSLEKSLVELRSKHCPLVNYTKFCNIQSKGDMGSNKITLYCASFIHCRPHLWMDQSCACLEWMMCSYVSTYMNCFVTSSMLVGRLGKWSLIGTKEDFSPPGLGAISLTWSSWCNNIQWLLPFIVTIAPYTRHSIYFPYFPWCIQFLPLVAS